jgi:tetraacyldisaccharide 4'-kinase
LYTEKENPGEPTPSPLKDKRPVVAVAGIGNPTPFFNHLRQFKGPLQTLEFPDHYTFTSKGILRLQTALKNAGPDSVIITTEKDAVKLKHVNLPAEISKRIWYLPIQLKILFTQQNTFNKTVKTYVSTNQRNR